MRRTQRAFRFGVLVLFLAAAVVFAGETSKPHRDYVPDEKSALRIGEAVLLAQYGEEWVAAQLPLRADGSNGDYWIVQGVGPDPASQKGGGPAVCINKHTGCLQVMERLK